LAPNTNTPTGWTTPTTINQKIKTSKPIIGFEKTSTPKGIMIMNARYFRSLVARQTNKNMHAMARILINVKFVFEKTDLL
jgi:hypothetical protein